MNLGFDKSRIVLQVEYTHSNNSKCAKCGEFIQKYAIRYLVRELDTHVYGPTKNWYHSSCVWKSLEYGYDAIDDNISLSVIDMGREDQKEIRRRIAKFKNGPKRACLLPESSTNCQNEILKNKLVSSDKDLCSSISPATWPVKKSLKRYIDVIEIDQEEKSKKHKMNSLQLSIRSLKEELKQYFDVELEEELDEEAQKRKKEEQQEEERRKLLEQNVMMKKLRRFFKTLLYDERKTIYKRNGQSIPENREAAIEKLVDISLFGPPINCINCGNGQIYYDSKKKSYVCSGYVTQYTKCMVHTRNPVRSFFLLPSYMDKSCEYDHLPFNSSFARLYYPDDEILPTIDEKSFRNTVAEELGDPKSMMSPTDGQVRNTENRLIVKNGEVVDSSLLNAEILRVHSDENGLYSTLLISTDLMCNRNSFFKIQLLRYDHMDEFILWQSWGRIGTHIGKTVTICYKFLEKAKTDFEKIFYQETMNQWKNRHNFEKYPGYYNYIEVDLSEIEYSDCVPDKTLFLSAPVRDSMKSIFDIKARNQNWPMEYFITDLEQMPLGIVSKRQLYLATNVLLELQVLIDNADMNQFKIYDLSNHFYNIIPHNFGMDVPKPIASMKIFNEKIDMLNMLADTEYKFNQLRRSHKASTDIRNSFIEVHQELKYDLEALDPYCADYATITEYMKNTQGSTHSTQHTLIDIIRVKSKIENRECMKAIGCRALLWHGSRKENFAGILRQGLKIAPEGPVSSGHMFGKGAYFADMFSKSLGYCNAGHGEEAYLLLCEVALGKPYELIESDKNMNLRILFQKQLHSVHGVGREVPRSAIRHSDGYLIPLGLPIMSRNTRLRLQYNEYVVYDTNQFEIRYLVKVRVKDPQRN